MLSVSLDLACVPAAGPMLNEEGDIIISEDEYLEICRLKDLKVAYRSDFDELKQLKSEVQYCQKLVDQCRQRLIQGDHTPLWFKYIVFTLSSACLVKIKM